MHYRELPLASKAVEFLPKIQEKHEGFCKGCLKEKNTKKTFPSSESKAKGILEMSSSYLSRYVYYVSFIDDFSRKNKDEVFSKFKEFKALIKNPTEKNIKTF